MHRNSRSERREAGNVVLYLVPCGCVVLRCGVLCVRTGVVVTNPADKVTIDETFRLNKLAAHEDALYTGQ